MFLWTTTIHKYIHSFILILLLSVQTVAEDQDITNIFVNEGLTGTIVISSVGSGETFIHNDLRANYRFTVASTFKILNTLIALEEKVISGKDDLFKWDGHMYAISDWNCDQTLESAFKVSCVWCFQELARRVGVQKYQSYLQNTSYGELHEPFDGETFWLDGSLKISAMEQVEFLKKVYQRTLPFSTSSYETLRQIMLVEQTPAYSIRGKTGLAGGSKPKIGWYVGYVETSKDVWVFATNIDIYDQKDLSLRLKLTRDALQIKGVVK
ncbi:class D beta-lactamase [Sulfurovum sp.]|uniref:class D beta-lactamase n=1 Tax=Sulfurovum sp. TaxID=1969726 RepID=UPI00356802F0